MKHIWISSSIMNHTCMTPKQTPSFINLPWHLGVWLAPVVTLVPRSTNPCAPPQVVLDDAAKLDDLGLDSLDLAPWRNPRVFSRRLWDVVVCWLLVFGCWFLLCWFVGCLFSGLFAGLLVWLVVAIPVATAALPVLGVDPPIFDTTQQLRDPGEVWATPLGQHSWGSLYPWSTCMHLHGLVMCADDL